MAEETQKVVFKPGIIRDLTSYSNEGGWFACDKIRFHHGTPEIIGGWARFSTDQFDGVCRALHTWTTLDGTNAIAVGTHTKLYICVGGSLFDITPIRRTVTLGANPLSTTNGSALVTVHDVAHGATVGSAVIFSGASAFNNVTINGEYTVTSVTDVDNYVITAGTVANATGSGGGAAVQAQYLINIGSDSYAPNTGWGTGSWGSGPWGGPSSGSGTIVGDFRLWFFDNWGEDL